MRPTADAGPALRRSRDDRMIVGVMGGIARFAGLDADRLRLAFVVLAVLSAGFPGILVYLALWFVIPDER
ncbi:MAG: PspC domain-containing protein [Gemmatimonadota bacterium]